jgi:hypothetical protein
MVCWYMACRRRFTERGGSDYKISDPVRYWFCERPEGQFLWPTRPIHYRNE